MADHHVHEEMELWTHDLQVRFAPLLVENARHDADRSTSRAEELSQKVDEGIVTTQHCLPLEVVAAEEVRIIPAQGQIRTRT